MEIKEASRQGFKPLVGLYSGSSCGKTFSALLLARGFVGPSGEIGMIDTESGRGSLYAGVAPIGRYKTLELDNPFSPARYIEAINAIEKSGAQIGIIDSASHEWEGIGGVCDMAMDNEQKSGRAGLHNWRTPKMEHGKFVGRMLRSSIPWIVCIRAKQKSRQGKDERGKTIITKDDHEEPIQSEDFIFEMTAYGHLDKDHRFSPLKSMHPTLAKCFPVDAPIETKHGELLAQWCANASAKPSTAATDATRAWMLAEIRKAIPEDRLISIAERSGYILAGETLEAWKLAAVPTTREGLKQLIADLKS